jgi:hypothetical protein
VRALQQLCELSQLRHDDRLGAGRPTRTSAVQMRGWAGSPAIGNEGRWVLLSHRAQTTRMAGQVPDTELKRW